MKALRKRKRVKTDPADAYELANLLRLGSLPEAYIAPPDLRELRELVRHRRQLLKLATSITGGVRALLAKHNIRLSARATWTVTPRRAAGRARAARHLCPAVDLAAADAAVGPR
jgi:transposase